MRSKSGQITIMIVCLVLGIMLSVQFKTARVYDTSMREPHSTELTEKLNTVTAERDSLAKEVTSLRENMAHIQNDDGAVANIKKELQKSNIAAGLLPVQGPGLIVILNDSPRSLQPGENPNILVVHDLDILRLVNELKASGAEAISVNDERITSMSEIRCAGTTILVNSNRIGTPFVIKATGKPDLLNSGINIRNGIIDELRAVGIQVQIQQSDKVDIPAYKGSLNFEYSSAVPQKSEGE